MIELINQNEITTDIIDDEVAQGKDISLSILRLDKIHPVISGNKLFKLHYYLEDAINSTHKKIITFGGAYSNHLAATAFAGKLINLNTVGIVRGEQPKQLSHTLQFCIEQGMQIEFVSREAYSEKETETFKNMLFPKFGDHILIPEGGFGEKGVKGAALINAYFDNKDYTHVCTAVGTATTFAGIINSSKKAQTVLGFSALKNMRDIEERLKILSAGNNDKTHAFINEYDFGGYAKKTPELILFMNRFFDQHQIPLDFVYTGKMMFGIKEMIRKDYFPTGSKILCIHTGGLQGNLSLPKGMLNF